MAQTLEPKITLCADCKLRLEEYKAAMTSGRISEKEALRNAVRNCDTEEYRFFYPFGFSKHGVTFVAEAEAARNRAMRQRRQEPKVSE